MLVGPFIKRASNYYCDKRNARGSTSTRRLNHRAMLKRQTYEVKEELRRAGGGKPFNEGKGKGRRK